jgi:Uma2 family endonuclease
MHMAQQTKPWTLADLHRLPDDGNKYELVRGELFVTPAPSVGHEELASTLGRILDRYAEQHGLGLVYRPRAVVQTLDSEVEPDIMVRSRASKAGEKWAQLPLPILIVEIVSSTTRRRDHLQKRALYVDAGIPEYWIVDGYERTVRVVRPGEDDNLIRESLTWHPTAASDALTIDLPTFFRDALGT